MFLNVATMPRILAHRGQVQNENTLAAFESALQAGADIIETDIQCTKDGFPVIFHDADLSRFSSKPRKIESLTLSEILAIKPDVPTLEQALNAFPTAKFNIDFKSAAAIQPAIQVIRKCTAQSRVLAASFSEKRINRVHNLAPELVRSLSGIRVFLAYLFRFAAKSLTRGFVAAQIPTKWGPLTLATPRFVRELRVAGLEVHFWVVNEETDVDRLLALGADGFVTDETARLVSHLRKA